MIKINNAKTSEAGLYSELEIGDYSGTGVLFLDSDDDLCVLLVDLDGDDLILALVTSDGKPVTCLSINAAINYPVRPAPVGTTVTIGNDE